MLGTLFVVMVLLGWVFGEAYGYPLWGVLLGVVVAVTMVLSAYYDGARRILEYNWAFEATQDTHPQLVNIVDEMRIASGLPMPKVFVIESDAMNAFATGRDPEHAVVAVTNGLLENLNREELQAVIGHEISHIHNYDIRYMMVVAATVGAVVLLSDGFMGSARYGGLSMSRRRKSFGPVAVLALALAIFAPIFAMFLQMAISRDREYLADASAARFTRNPLALASALEKIDVSVLNKPLPSANRATQHLYIVNPLRSIGMASSELMSTHPPTEERIRRLRQMGAMNEAQWVGDEIK
ncbi:M48 family metallopeptidase [bacterium]|nr:M48 family metallopeptidase [bacterium]RQV96590.1 MAG: zinc metalloprotease HtpX [bacterium]